MLLYSVDLFQFLVLLLVSLHGANAVSAVRFNTLSLIQLGFLLRLRYSAIGANIQIWYRCFQVTDDLLLVSCNKSLAVVLLTRFLTCFRCYEARSLVAIIAAALLASCTHSLVEPPARSICSLPQRFFPPSFLLLLCSLAVFACMMIVSLCRRLVDRFFIFPPPSEVSFLFVYLLLKCSIRRYAISF